MTKKEKDMPRYFSQNSQAIPQQRYNNLFIEENMNNEQAPDLFKSNHIIDNNDYLLSQLKEFTQKYKNFKKYLCQCLKIGKLVKQVTIQILQCLETHCFNKQHSKVNNQIDQNKTRMILEKMKGIQIGITELQKQTACNKAISFDGITHSQNKNCHWRILQDIWNEGTFSVNPKLDTFEQFQIISIICLHQQFILIRIIVVSINRVK